MGASCSSPTPRSLPTSVPSLPSFPDYTGAGILFVEGPVVLAGIQKYGRVLVGGKAVLSGLGGRKEPTDLDWLHTAWREVIEELFNVKQLPASLLQELRLLGPGQHTVFTSGYVLAHLGFTELTRVLVLCKQHGLTSNLYEKMPLTITDLVMNRQCSSQAEIGPLALLPVQHRVLISEQFLSDLVTYRSSVPPK